MWQHRSLGWLGHTLFRFRTIQLSPIDRANMLELCTSIELIEDLLYDDIQPGVKGLCMIDEWGNAKRKKRRHT
jgi:hypothetical protein